MASKLNSRYSGSFSVRNCRERYTLLADKLKKKNGEEIRASGIAPEYDELDNLLQDLYDIEKGAKENQEQQKVNEKEAKEKAEGMRKRMLESMGETTVREKVKRKATSNNQMIVNYLEKRKTDELAIREREVQVRERELALREREIDVRERDMVLREQEMAMRGHESANSHQLLSTLTELVIVQKDLVEKLSKASTL